MEIANIRFDNFRDWLDSLKEFQLDSMYYTTILGKAYTIHSAIEIIKEKDTTIEASYHGNDTYTIALNIENGKVVGSCSCPYPLTCKHIAALHIQLLKNKD